MFEHDLLDINIVFMLSSSPMAQSQAIERIAVIQETVTERGYLQR